MTENELRILMLLMGVKPVMIAKQCRKPRSYVHQVITGVRAFPDIRKAIADAVKKSVDEIWPPKSTNNDDCNQVNHLTRKDTSRQARK